MLKIITVLLTISVCYVSVQSLVRTVSIHEVCRNLKTSHQCTIPSEVPQEVEFDPSQKTNYTNYDIINSNLVTIPKNLFRVFPDVNQLTIKSNLQYINKSSFESDTPISVTFLRLSGNFLEKIPAETFENLPKLLFLVLASNQITEIEIGAFKGLEKISILDLSNNLLDRVERGVFEHLKNLKYLLLQNNKIQVIDKDAIPNGLDFLGLQNNQFANFELNSSVSVVDISNGVVQRCSIQKAVAVIATNNEISEFELRETNGTRAIEIGNNFMIDVGFLGEFQDLRTLDLSYNPILRLDPELFGNLTKLEVLRLTSIFLFEVPETFSNLTNLRTLVLSNNSIKTFDAEILSSMPLLKNLDLENNNLTDFKYQNVPIYSPKLEYISLYNNSFERSNFNEIANFFISKCIRFRISDDDRPTCVG